MSDNPSLHAYGESRVSFRPTSIEHQALIAFMDDTGFSKSQIFRKGLKAVIPKQFWQDPPPRKRQAGRVKQASRSNKARA